MSRIVDCFPFFKEKELLELRIRLLYDQVDQFLICEANKTHSGVDKEYICENILAELNLKSDKIKVIKVDLPGKYENKNNLFRERAQRDAFVEHLQEGDICIVSDCDEIINPTMLKRYIEVARQHPENVLRVPMVNLHGRADLKAFDTHPERNHYLWVPAYIGLKEHFVKYTPSQIRESTSVERYDIEFTDIFITENNKLLESGWHFSWMGSNLDRLEKSKAFLHANDYIIGAIAQVGEPELENFILNFNPKNGKTDVLGRNRFILETYPIEKLPSLLLKNKKLKEYFLPEVTIEVTIDVNVEKMNKLQQRLNDYIERPEEAEVNWEVGCIYLGLGHTASAVSFFLRCAERSNSTLLQYESLIKAADCYKLQGCRTQSVTGLLQQAVSLIPTRPEAYLRLAEYYESEKRWFDSYTFASVGEKLCTFDNLIPLRTEPTSTKRYQLLFSKAVAGWWCGLIGESKSTFKELMYSHTVPLHYKKVIRSNFDFLKLWSPRETRSQFLNKEEEIEKTLEFKNSIVRDNVERLVCTFKNSEKLDHTFSEFLQDLFVLICTDGKMGGTYVEIGTGHSFYGNNTALLETKYGWKGVSIDYCKGFVEEHFKERENFELYADAREVNYHKVFETIFSEKNIDYLQIDCDPPNVSLEVLKTIPFDKYKFGVITFEHDHYQDSTYSVREESRKFLQDRGYKMIVSNIGKEGKAVEDWWIHPDIINYHRLLPIVDRTDTVKEPKELLLKK